MSDEGITITSDMAEQFIGSTVGAETTDGMALAGMLVELDEEKKALKARMDALNDNMDTIKGKLLSVFESYGVNSIHVNGATVYLSQQISAKVRGDRAAAVVAIKAWAPDCVTENFNLNTVSALLREAMKEGGFTDPKNMAAELPSAVAECIAVDAWYDIRIRKS